MARVKRGTKRRARRKKYLKRTKGFFLTKSKLYQSAQEAANRADRYAFRDRRVKKRQYRRLWIQRIGAAARLNGLTYGQLIHGLKAAGDSTNQQSDVQNQVQIKLKSIQADYHTALKNFVVQNPGGGCPLNVICRRPPLVKGLNRLAAS